MDIAQIQAFVTVADLRSFVRASERLHLSQPAVTKRIHAFEETVGAAVFTRSRGGVTLTPVGREVLPPARGVLQACERFEATLRREIRLTEQLRVGTTFSVANHLLPALLGRLANTKVSLRAGFAPDVIDWVRAGTVDLGIVRCTGAETGLAVRSLWREELVFVAPPDHPLAARADADADQLRRFPMVAYGPPSSFTPLLDEYWRRHGGGPQVKLYVDQVEAMRRLVLAGHGTGVMPLSSAWDELQAGRLVRLQRQPTAGLSYQVGAVYLPESLSTARSRFLADLEQEITRQPFFRPAIAAGV